MDLNNPWWTKNQNRRAMRSTLADLQAQIDSGGGGGSTPVIGYWYTATGGVTSLAATATTLVISTQGYVSDGSKFTLASNGVSVTDAGVYRIHFDCYLNSGGSSRSEYSVWMNVNDVEQPGTRAAAYQRGYDSGTSCSVVAIASLSASDEITFSVQRTAGSGTAGYQDANGTRLIIEKIS